ncbi:MAG: hypothetical protein EAZ89_05240 [Bacteroidetes bacterium]|nr:MAG: hypothetical protein EAZ89_05240 [Bacteroidota bacterium]
MNQIKRLLGIIWIVLGPAAIAFMFMQAAQKITAAAPAAKANIILQWGIIITIFVPIAIGLVIFGYYAFKGEYDHLPESSLEL